MFRHWARTHRALKMRISELEEDSLGGQMAMMPGGSIKSQAESESPRCVDATPRFTLAG
jgi:hypothetical protein